MRLRQIKLSGFKSFVDLTVIPTPSDLVGVVGPNGCGKSNIIDAVRWVLGESKASELRGASMQDVIFNGSSERKAAARASVELVFDNSLGRAAGQWSSYAEISVRRVLNRDGASSYLINNQQVRRRDVYDIFLGTGLGARGYAIIGQGMINRLIEARPEELRIYLEEAAGVSRYKERRRETENRLHSTRENLIRLEDIIRELDGQLEKLQNQAIVAKKYQALQADGELKQNALWFLREQSAAVNQKKLADEYANEQLKLEQQLANLRATQSELELQRTKNYDFNQAVHNAQGQLFEASAIVSRYEAEIKHATDMRQRIQARRLQLQTQSTQWQEQQQHASAAIADLLIDLEQANELVIVLEQQAAVAQDDLPQLDDKLAALHAQRENLRQNLAQQEQNHALQLQTIQEFEKQSQLLADRFSKLSLEQVNLVVPSTESIDELQAEFALAQARTEQAQDNLIKLESAFAEQNKKVDACLELKQVEQQKLDKLVAQQDALVALQAKIQAKDDLLPWLERHGLANAKQLWQEIQIPDNWTNALEAILRERMQAIAVASLNDIESYLADMPPANIAFYELTEADDKTKQASNSLLIDYVKVNKPEVKGLLQYWLRNVYVADTVQQALNMVVNGIVVVPAGHIIDQHSVRFYAANDEQAGLLFRAQQIKELNLAIKAASLLLSQAEQEYEQSLNHKQQLANELQQIRGQTSTYLRAEHDLQLKLSQIQQQLNNANVQQQRLSTDLNEIKDTQFELAQQAQQTELAAAQCAVLVQDLQAEVLILEQQINDLAQQLTISRKNSHEQEKRLQNAKFNVRSLSNRRSELERNLSLATDQLQTAADELEELQGDLFELDESVSKANLEQALEARILVEQDLRLARSAQEHAETELRTIDQKRLQIEQSLEPQRAKITDLQLKEQASRLNIEQYAEQLNERQVDRQALQLHIERNQWQNMSWLQSEVQSINRKIAALGAVNLAALDELDKAQQRQLFLAAQQTDLQTAIDTLEAAIRKIDNETRALLKQTFDLVNQHFGELFPRLFGGGKASLSMTGDEVLDAGVQVMAQPPGKRNSTINLLSGGEKALTAIALVFAFFKLNPAPFCLLDEVDAPLDDANTERYANLVRSMSSQTQFLFISHNKIAMQMAKQLIGVTMQEQGVSRIVAVDMDAALQLTLPTA